MGYIYNFVREQDEFGNWLINNPYYFDELGNQIFISKVIKDNFPLNNSTMKCAGASASFEFQNELSSEEQTTLSTLVENYQNYRPTTK